MSYSGGYAHINRTGVSKNQLLELIHKNLNNARGTAYNTDQGSVVFYENYAYAKAIASAWEMVARFGNQFQPSKISAFLDRWEKILGILPDANLDDTTRLNLVSQKFQLWAKPPTNQNVADFIKAIAPQIFIDVEHNAASLNRATFPGGLVVPGGVNLADGVFSSRTAHLKIRIWQPRDKDNNITMPTPDFLKQVNLYQTFLDNYLPAYVNFDSFRFAHQTSGTVSGSAGSHNLVGTSTSFTTQLSPGQKIELVDDNEELQTYTVDTITDNTHMSIVETLENNSTNNYIYITGFFFDDVSNLDNESL